MAHAQCTVFACVVTELRARISLSCFNFQFCVSAFLLFSMKRHRISQKCRAQTTLALGKFSQEILCWWLSSSTLFVVTVAKLKSSNFSVESSQKQINFDISPPCKLKYFCRIAWFLTSGTIKYSKKSGLWLSCTLFEFAFQYFLCPRPLQSTTIESASRAHSAAPFPGEQGRLVTLLFQSFLWDYRFNSCFMDARTKLQFFIAFTINSNWRGHGRVHALFPFCSNFN